MVTKPTFKIGLVSVSQLGPDKWALRYIDPTTGADVRRRVAGLEYEEVKEMSKNLTKQAYMGKGYLAGLAKAPTIKEGLAKAIELSRARPYIRRDMANLAALFHGWLARSYPAARTWAEVKPFMLEEYARSIERIELSHASLRHRLGEAVDPSRDQ